jgi:phosphatidylserine/phosphatidylglycerophosphate/cardiolipin synthase-like enzyme
VQVVVDEKASKSKAATAALNILVNAGIPTRLNGSYAIHHDKYMIIDGLHVQTGSFNYSRAAAASTSEHVIVVWNAPRTAAAYAKHWQTRFDKGADYVSRY